MIETKYLEYAKLIIAEYEKTGAAIFDTEDLIESGEIIALYLASVKYVETYGQ